MNDGETALFVAFQNGHLEFVQLLLWCGAGKALAKDDGARALIVASQNGHLEVVRLLLESGADKDRAFRPRMSSVRVWG